MRSLVSVSLLALSLTVCGVQGAQAQLKINPYPVQDEQSQGRVAPSGQLDPAVVRDLLARQQARDVQADAPPVVFETVPVAMPASAVVEAVDPVIVTPVAVEPVQAVEIESGQRVIASDPSLVPAYLGRAQVFAPPKSLQVEPSVEAEVPSVPVAKAEISAPRYEHTRIIASDPSLVPESLRGRLADQGAAVPASAERVEDEVVVEAADYMEPIAPKHVEGKPAVAPVRVARPAAARLPVLDRVKVIVEPREVNREFIVPQRDGGVVLPVAGAAPAVVKPEVDVVEVEHIVTRADTLEPVDMHVAKLDQAADYSPAHLQEEAMRRGVQAQGGMVIADPLEGRVLAGRDEFERVAIEPMAIVPERSAKELVLEADAILDASIARHEGLVKPVARQGGRMVPASEALVMPSQGDLQLAADETPVELVSVDVQVEEKHVKPVEAKPVVPVMAGWHAEAGESAYAILQEWSDRAGVDVVWASEFLVNVRRPVRVDGSYEEAVSALLEQYADLYAGVQGTLYRDGQSGRRVLYIQTNGRS